MTDFEKILIGLKQGSLSMAATRKLIASLYAGFHPSRYRGHGDDFWEHQEWTPEDELSQIDWIVSLQPGVDGWQVRKMREEKQLKILILLDLKRTMDFGSQTLTKAEIALLAATLLGLGSISFEDLVRFVVISDSGFYWQPLLCSRPGILNGIEGIYKTHDRAVNDDETIRKNLGFIEEQAVKGEVIFFFSDFLLDELSLKSLLRLKTKHDLRLIWIRDKAEINFPRTKLVSCQGSRSRFGGDASSKDFQKRFSEEIRFHERRVKEFMRENALSFVELNEDSDLITKLKIIMR